MQQIWCSEEELVFSESALNKNNPVATEMKIFELCFWKETSNDGRIHTSIQPINQNVFGFKQCRAISNNKPTGKFNIDMPEPKIHEKTDQDYN